jgi:protein TonB
MKKLFFLFFVLFISFSFGQTKKKVIVTHCPEVKDTIRIVKVNTGNFNDDDLTINPLNSIQAVISEEENTIYNAAGIEVKPEFPGGIQNFYAFVGKNYKMPDEVGLNGKVYVSFVVEKDGSLTNIKVLRDIGYGTGKEAVRVLQFSPKWNPGEQNGKKVRCSYSLPISLPQKK